MVKLVFSAIVAVALAAGCSDRRPAASAVRPRVVSFSPALTETLFDLGLGRHVVGVTRYCILPPGESAPALGDAFDVNAEAILSVDPDVLLVQTSDLRRFEGVRQIDPEVRIEQFQIETLADIKAAIERIGRILGREDLARQGVQRFEAKLDAVSRPLAGLARPRVLFVTGTDRPAVAGPGTFIHELIGLAGGVNVGTEIPGKTRWRETHVEAILAAAPEVLICQARRADEVESVKAYWLGWENLPAARDKRVHVVTDRHWSIPSIRVADLAPKLAEMIHPGAAGGGRQG